MDEALEACTRNHVKIVKMLLVGIVPEEEPSPIFKYRVEFSDGRYATMITCCINNLIVFLMKAPGRRYLQLIV